MDSTQNLLTLPIQPPHLLQNLPRIPKCHFFLFVGILDRQIICCRIDARHIGRPGIRGVCLRLLELDELGEILLGERIALSEVPIEVELVVPDPLRRSPLREEEDDGLDSGSREGAAGQIEDRMEVAGFEQEFPQRNRSIVGIREEGVLDDDSRTSSCFEDFNEMLKEE